MKQMVPALGLLAVLLFAGRAQATLIDRGGGLIYDTDLNITWTQQAGDGVLRNWAGANAWATALVFGGFPAKADNSAVFVGSDFSLLRAGKDYRIAHYYEIVEWNRLTDSLSRQGRMAARFHARIRS